MGSGGYFGPQNRRQAFFFWVLFPVVPIGSSAAFVMGGGTNWRLFLAAILTGGAAAVSGVSAALARHHRR